MMTNIANRANPLFIRWRSALILAILTAVSLSAYLFASRVTSRFGLPLDDAWIHQTYARNLALSGEWAFIPGQPSAGSTSPLWTVLLSIGYFLRLPPLAWTYLLGGVLLWTLAVVIESAYLWWFQLEKSGFPWMGLLVILEWHLVWAAGSGMETLLFALMATLVLLLLLGSRPPWLALGLLTGLAVWVRPDGITLLGPILVAFILQPPGWQRRFTSLSLVLGGFLVPFVPYLLFNHALSGQLWPNTFYAKQLEYAALLDQSLPLRFLREAALPFVGVLALLLPGIGILTWKAWVKRHWGALLPIIWVIGFLFMYAWRLPVTYQHGRYVIPVLPILLFAGGAGYAEILGKAPENRVRWIVERAWGLSAAVMLLAFWIIGMRTYSKDVAVIETEMVDTARWIAQNTSGNSLIAAHDIGALGYFGNRHIIDLAGLISPQVTPFMRDENRLVEYLDREGVDYLETFPDWYVKLPAGRELVYTSGGRFAVELGYENMGVYRWK